MIAAEAQAFSARVPEGHRRLLFAKNRIEHFRSKLSKGEK
jgi:hypothetical protein